MLHPVRQIRLSPGRQHRLDILVQAQAPCHRVVECCEVDLREQLIPLALRMQRRLQLMPLMQLVQLLHALLQRDGNQQSHRNRSNMDDEIFPRMLRMRNMNIEHLNIEHRFVLLRSLRKVCSLVLKGRDFSPAISCSLVLKGRDFSPAICATKAPGL